MRTAYKYVYAYVCVFCIEINTKELFVIARIHLIFNSPFEKKETEKRFSLRR